MENLKNIIKEIKGYRESLELKDLSDDTILIASVNIFNVQQEKEVEDFGNKASEKQIDFLRDLGYKGSEEISKFDATELIKELKKKNGMP